MFVDWTKLLIIYLINDEWEIVDATFRVKKLKEKQMILNTNLFLIYLIIIPKYLDMQGFFLLTLFLFVYCRLLICETNGIVIVMQCIQFRHNVNYFHSFTFTKNNFISEYIPYLLPDSVVYNSFIMLIHNGSWISNK